MAQIPEEILVGFLDVLRQLLLIVNQCSSVEYEILQQYNETEMTIDALDSCRNQHFSACMKKTLKCNELFTNFVITPHIVGNYRVSSIWRQYFGD